MFLWAILLVTAALVVRVEINHDSTESQRFFVAPFFAAVVLALVHLDRMPRGSFGSVLVLLGVLVPAVLSINWTTEQASLDMADYLDGRPPLPDRMFDASTAARTSARIFLDKVKSTVRVDSNEFSTSSGAGPFYNSGLACRQLAGAHRPGFDPIPQLRGLDADLVGKDEDLDAPLPRRRQAQRYRLRARAVRNRASCRSEGRYLRCPLSPLDRSALLGRSPK